MMKFWIPLTYAAIYISEAVIHIFTPSNDDYPKIGKNSFEGDVHKAKWVD